MQIITLPDLKVSNDLKETIYQLEATCYAQSLERIKADYKKLHFSPTLYHLLGYQEDQLITYLRVIKRELSWDGHPYLLGGIGSVCTKPSYQGKGLASSLLQEAMRILEGEKIDFALLQTNIKKGAKLYGQVGFQPVAKECVYTDCEGNRQLIQAKDVMMAPINNLDLMQDIIKSNRELYIGNGDW